MGVSLLDRLLRQAPACDAVFCCNDDLAFGVLFECQRRGIRVPERLAVCGFNDLAAAEWISPALTTVATPRYEIGHAAASTLLALLKGEEPGPRKRDLGFSLIIREST
jgi:LacI family gluconate utilization system Gnt-I transcriptional repressor